MRVLIVDDEAAARRGLRRQLDELPDMTCVGACSGPKEAVAAIVERQPDVVLLDIKLGGSSAFEIIDEIGVDAMPVVIFVTAYDRHAVKAFEVHAVDYVLKPVDPVRLREALERAAEAISTRRSAAVIDRLERLLAARPPSAAPPSAPTARRFVVLDGERASLLEARNIDWFESAGNWVCVHVGGRTYTMRTTMDRVSHRLAGDDGFIRARRSAIVNVRAIATFERYGKASFALRLRDGATVVSSRFYYPQVRELLRADRPS
jgi:two-component system LytT family response regulator